MYRIYTSEAFILNTRIQGEANLTVNALTRDYGLIRAMAQGAMFIKSKNRFSLQKLALSELSFVRGKEIWRITTTRPISAVHTLCRESKSSMARVFSIVERLVHGEEKDQKLFELLLDYYEFISNNDTYDHKSELVILFRVLHHLGYIGDLYEFRELLLSEKISATLLNSIYGKERDVRNIIEHSLTATQL